MYEKYQIELWSRNGLPVLDISRYVKSFSYSMQRNEAEDLSFSIDLRAYEDICDSLNLSPTSVLSPYQTDVKIKRNGTYLFGTHVGEVNSSLGEADATISVRAFGYLNLLVDRYVTKDYVATDATAIAWDLIDTTQDQTNGSMGMTYGAQQVSTVDRDRTYVRQNVKEGIINLTKLVDGNFDFNFSWDKKFNTYTMIGTNQSNSLEFFYPGNIISVQIPRSGKPLFNKLYGLGSGFGQDQLQSTQSDSESQLIYGVHEKIAIFNSVSVESTLQQNVAAELQRRKDILEIPQMTVSGDDFDLNTFGIGDRVYVKIENSPFLANINGVYRIERIEVSVDEQEAEIIKLYFDNQGLIEESDD